MKEKKPYGYWRDKELCIEESKKYRNLKEFQTKCYGAYRQCKLHGWLDEVNSLYDKTVLYHSFDEPIHCVYVYEFVENNACYIGRTNNIKRRDNQHRKHSNSTLLKYCTKNNISNIPNPIILKDGLNAEESQYYEDEFIKEYINNGWIVLNKAVTGINKGSLGAVCKWNYELCREEALKYSSITEFEVNNQSAYKAAVKNRWIDDFFERNKRVDGYWNDYIHCKEAVEQCDSVRELIGKFGGVYNAMRRNGFFDLIEKLKSK